MKFSPRAYTRAALSTGLLLFSLIHLASGQSALEQARPDRLYDAEAVKAIIESERGATGYRLAPAALEDTSGYDVQKYTIHYDVDIAGKRIAARVKIDGVVTAPLLSAISLDFVGFDISRVTIDGAPASYSRTNQASILRLLLAQGLTTGQSFAIEVAYSGEPKTNLGFRFRKKKTAATFAEPDGARNWFPCKDRPSDKAVYEGFITVPRKYTVASNGRLVETTESDGQRTFHWLETHPIATYLISLAIGRYKVIEDRLGDLPIMHYVFPEQEAEARRDFSRTPEMIRVFQNRMGVQYPFDKYGHALVHSFSGGMEHQTITSYGVALITGDNRYDRIVAHELGHHWFGNLVSPAEWEEIWLNEGLATWTEFLWTEHADPDFLPRLMAQREQTYMAYEAQYGAYSLYAPSALFGTTVYLKGGWVVAMLRDLVGDAAFFSGIRAYLLSHSFGNATSRDLRAAMEEASGRDLSAFFNEWVFGVGYPVYEASWSATAVSGGYRADLRIEQKQTGRTVFTTPVEVEAVAADGTRSRHRVEVTGADTVVSLSLNFNPVKVTVDPDNRVLGTVL